MSIKTTNTGSIRKSNVPLPVQEGQLLADKYRVERVVGSGGMGVVVAAWHVELEHRVAIKFLQYQVDQRLEALSRFRREARAAAKIQSEHVVRVFDVGTLPDATPYIVMEYLEGRDLAQELRARGPLSIVEAADFVLQAIDALAEVHALGIVHRDLKPANLFLTQRADGSRVLKILDFGVSKPHWGETADVDLTRAEIVIGSPQYMAPEQLNSAADVDCRADIWSLGAILYKILTGRSPYAGTSVPMVCASLLRDTPHPVSEMRTDVPPELEAAIARCLCKDREGRFESVGDLAAELAPFASPAGKLCAERAGRVTIATIATPAPAPAPATLAPLKPRNNELRMSLSDRTADPWGNTQGPPPKMQRTALAFGGVAGLAAVAALAFLTVMRNGDKPTEAASPVAAAVAPVAAPTLAAVTPVAPAAAAPAPAAAPQPEAEPFEIIERQPGRPMPSRPQQRPEAPARPAGATPTPAAPAPAPEPAAAVPAATTPEPAAPAAAPAPPAAVAPPAAAPESQGISDFGGRR